MDVGDPFGLGPGLGNAESAGHAVGRLHVGDPEDVVRVRHGLVEEEVGAAVDEDREDLELLGDGTERWRVAARGDAAEEVDILGELETPELLDVRVRAGILVGLEDLDLSLAQGPTGSVDLLRRASLATAHRT